jgi:hypothetical protein
MFPHQGRSLKRKWEESDGATSVMTSVPANAIMLVTVYVTKVHGSAVTYDTYDFMLDYNETRTHMEAAFEQWTPVFILYLLDEMFHFIKDKIHSEGSSSLRFQYTGGVYRAVHKETARKCGFQVLPDVLVALLDKMIAFPSVFSHGAATVTDNMLHATIEIIETS